MKVSALAVVDNKTPPQFVIHYFNFIYIEPQKKLDKVVNCFILLNASKWIFLLLVKVVRNAFEDKCQI